MPTNAPPSTSQTGADAPPVGISNRSRIVSLQAARGIAAVWVLLFHLDWILRSQPTHELFFGGAFSSGHLGVDFFFVLSGFIITHAHFSDVGQPTEARRYVLNRFIRIYPLLFIINAAKLAYLALASDAATHQKLNPLVVVRSFFVMTSIDNGLVDVAWTLTHEAMFYALFLLVIVLGWRAGAVMAAVWTAGILALAVTVDAELDAFHSVVFSPRNLQFITGVLACLAARRGLTKTIASASLLAGLALVAAGIPIESLTHPNPTFQSKSYWAVAFAALVAGITSLEHQTGWKPPAWLAVLGDASYSIYLFHTSILLVLFKLATKTRAIHFFGNSSFTMLALGIGSLAASLVIWFLLERPMTRALRHHIRPGPRTNHPRANT